MTDNIKTASALATAAMAAMAPGAAEAADNAAAPQASDNPLSVTVIGGLVMSDFSQNNVFSQEYGLGKLGYFGNLGPEDDIGGFGSIALGSQLEAGSALDWRLTGAITEFQKSATGFEYNLGDESVDVGTADNAGWQNLSLELGHSTSGDNLDMRIAAGLQATRLDRMSSGSFSYDSYSYNLSYGYEDNSLDLTIANNFDFLGAGPRLSMETRIGGTVGLELAGSVAALFGKSNSKGTGLITYDYDEYGANYYGYSGGSSSDSDWNWLYNTEVSAGLSVRPGESTNISAGYRYERMDELNTGSEKGLISHGPYVKLKASF